MKRICKNTVIGALHTKVVQNVLENFNATINEEDFINGNRLIDKNFMRERFFTFKELIYFILQKNNGSYQSELNSYFLNHKTTDEIEIPTASAFCQARAKIEPEAFKRLNLKVCQTFYSLESYKKWKGSRVLAIDGSTLQLPNHPSIKEDFGVTMMGPKKDSPGSLARISYLYDVLNKVVLDSEIKSYKTSEIDMAWDLKEHLAGNDILLADKLYASIALLCTLKAYCSDFCFAMKNNHWIKVRKFTKSKNNDQEITIEIPRRHLGWAEDNQIPLKINVRLIKYKNKKGETEVLCTSLLDKEKYSREEIIELYSFRWQEEECYKLLKRRLEVEHFSGKKSLVVKQDFYAKTLLLTLNAILMHDIEPSQQKTENSDRHIKTNFTLSLSTTKRVVVLLMKGIPISKVIKIHLKLTVGKFTYSRRGQSNPREKNNKSYRYSTNYKPVIT